MNDPDTLFKPRSSMVAGKEYILDDRDGSLLYYDIK